MYDTATTSTPRIGMAKTMAFKYATQQSQQIYFITRFRKKLTLLYSS